jgi:hypothetical protein
VPDVLRGAGAQIAQAYEAGGAACLSVLTDARYFQGSFNFLADIRGAGVACPLLCKEFIVEAYQLFKAGARARPCCLRPLAGPAARPARHSPPACSKGKELALACVLTGCADIEDSLCARARRAPVRERLTAGARAGARDGRRRRAADCGGAAQRRPGLPAQVRREAAPADPGRGAHRRRCARPARPHARAPADVLDPRWCLASAVAPLSVSGGRCRKRRADLGFCASLSQRGAAGARAELERVLRLDLGNAMLGINNRNLEDFTVDLGNTRAIMASPAGQEARTRSPLPSSPRWTGQESVVLERWWAFPVLSGRLAHKHSILARRALSCLS